MIRFVKKAEPQPSRENVEDNRFEQIRKAASEGRRKAATDDKRLRDGQPPKTSDCLALFEP